MPHLLANLGKGINKRVKKLFYHPYSVFNIGWTKEKILKHKTDQRLKYHIYKNKYKWEQGHWRVFEEPNSETTFCSEKNSQGDYSRRN